MKPVQILYFVDGAAPTPDDIANAASMTAHVMFRNARHIPAEGSLEACDGVAGKVPPRYAQAYPSAAEALAKRKLEVEALAARVGDSPAPAVPQAPAPATGAMPAAGAQQAEADTGGAGVATEDAEKPAPGAAPVGSMGAAWKSN